MRVSAVRLVIAGVALGAGALLSACTSQDTSAPASPTTATESPKAQPQAPEATGADGSKVDESNRKFPNTKQTVMLTGYDTKLDMVEFQLAHWVPGGPNNGHYAEVAGDTVTHRLPLAKNPTVLSALSLCPSDGVTLDSDGRGNTPCTKDRLLAKLKDGLGPIAEIKVDADDHIATVSELYAP